MATPATMAAAFSIPQSAPPSPWRRRQAGNRTKQDIGHGAARVVSQMQPNKATVPPTGVCGNAVGKHQWPAHLYAMRLLIKPNASTREKSAKFTGKAQG